MAAIEAEGLAKRYGDVEALRGVDLRAEEGTVFGLLGPNGAGKPTDEEGTWARAASASCGWS